MSITGERNIVKQVPVNAGYKQLIIDQAVLGMDDLDCSKQTLSRLDFQLKDAVGNTVDVHGNQWSLSVVFSKKQDES